MFLSGLWVLNFQGHPPRGATEGDRSRQKATEGGKICAHLRSRIATGVKEPEIALDCGGKRLVRRSFAEAEARLRFWTGQRCGAIRQPLPRPWTSGFIIRNRTPLRIARFNHPFMLIY